MIVPYPLNLLANNTRRQLDVQIREESPKGWARPCFVACWADGWGPLCRHESPPTRYGLTMSGACEFQISREVMDLHTVVKCRKQ
jgi:hypothetical protein